MLRCSIQSLRPVAAFTLPHRFGRCDARSHTNGRAQSGRGRLRRSRESAADTPHSTWEDTMKFKLQLGLDQLEVASFETQNSQSQPAEANVNVRTCLATNCGNIQCCA
jgi:hypothetical protein